MSTSIRHRPNTASTKVSTIANFRDVSTSTCSASCRCVRVRRGRLFRSGHTFLSSVTDADLLLNHYGIDTVVDLRTKGDAELATLDGTTYEANASRTNTLVQRLCRVGVIDSPNKVYSDEALAEKNKVIAFVPLGSARGVFVWALKAATWIQRLLLLLFSCLCMKKRALNVLVAVFNRHGLQGYNEAILTGSGAQMAAVLHLIALRASKPVLVHCTLGKDRTGLVIGILLKLLGVSDKCIIGDYTRSAQMTSSEHRRSHLPPYLNKDTFAAADADTLKDTFDFIDERYGGVDEYLDSIGVGSDVRVKLRQILLQD